MKIKDMSKQELREYYNKKMIEWRLKNPERNKELRKKYKKSPKGIISNKKYIKKYIELNRDKINKYHREIYKNNPTKQNKQYINEYLKNYMQDEENHKKYLIRQRDNNKYRKKLINSIGKCQFCNSKENLEIHHENYWKDGDILLLCRKCHRRLHRKDLNKTEVKK